MKHTNPDIFSKSLPALSCGTFEVIASLFTLGKTMASSRLAAEKRAIERRLRQEGFTIVHQAGSHAKWKNRQRTKTVTVPNRPRLEGDFVKSIYAQAGWPWIDSMVKNHPKKATKEPTMVAEAQRMSCTEILSSKTPTADSPPQVVVKQPTSIDAGKILPIKSKRDSWRDAETINLIAQDALENPTLTDSELARRWDMAAASYVRVKNGVHKKLTDRSVAMLGLVFGQWPVSKVPALVAEYRKDPSDIPAAVRRKLEAVLPRKEPPLIAAKVSDKVPAQETPMPLRPMPVAPVQTQRVQPVAPIAKTIESDPGSLKEVLEHARRIMRSMGVTKVVVPAEGEIVVHQKFLI